MRNDGQYIILRTERRRDGRMKDGAASFWLAAVLFFKLVAYILPAQIVNGDVERFGDAPGIA